MVYEEGLREVFEEVFPIEDYTGNIKLEFWTIIWKKSPNMTLKARKRDVNYATPLRVRVKLTVPDEDGSKIVKNEGGRARVPWRISHL